MNTHTYLVIGEDYSERMLLKELLNINLIDVVEAFNNIDGILKAEKHKDNLDAIVVDIDNGSGSYAIGIAYINSLAEKYKLPVIACYSNGVDRQLKQYFRLIDIETIEKPFFLRKIKPVIDRVISR